MNKKYKINKRISLLPCLLLLVGILLSTFVLVYGEGDTPENNIISSRYKTLMKNACKISLADFV